MEEVRGYHQLLVWQKSHLLVLAIYRATREFPSEEKFNLTNQIRRSALSIAANIVEGHASRFPKVFLAQLDKANGSLVETEYHLELARDLGYLSQERHQEINVLRNEVGKLLHGFRESVRLKTISS